MIVRELTGGIYFGEPRGIKPIDNGERKGINTHTYTTSEIERVSRVAFELAKKRNNKVTSCEKSNVMEAGQLWKEEIEVDLVNQNIIFGNNEIKFEIDSFKKKCLLEGLDDIALSLAKKDKIKSFEKNLKNLKPWIFND